MGGTIHMMRRTYSSCISPRRHKPALSILFLALSPNPAAAQESFDLERLLVSLGGMDRQEFAVIALVLAILGFSVVSAIQLMRTRIRAAENEVRLRSEIQALQAENDRSNALLLSEPQVVVSWGAADDRPQVAGDTSLLTEGPPHRALAFGTWLAPEPSLRLERAIDALRNDAESFALNLATSSGRAIEAVGRVVGGQAIVRFRELSGLRRDLADITLRYNALMEETEVLRGFASAIPAPVWARRANGTLSFANPGLRGCDRSRVERRCHQPQPRSARQPGPPRDGACAGRAGGVRQAIAGGDPRRAQDIRRAGDRASLRQRRHRDRRQRSCEPARKPVAHGGCAPANA